MKKTLLLLVMTLSAVVASASKPQLIGRRGCAYGVENSIESFRNGASMLGFDMMECHVRVTADSVYVAAHDGKTSRLGGNMKIASSPLVDLLDETYTQTIDGNTYTGRLLTISEYLDFCRSNNLTPLLHLKTMGKKDSDLSPLPGLVKLIEDSGMTGRCVILTSSQPYTDYFLSQAPGLKVVFQADGKWRELLPWILERKLDVDIKQDFVDAECVDTFHNAGLKVMTWTVNSLPDYQRLSALGVDQMITDTLSPAVMP